MPIFISVCFFSCSPSPDPLPEGAEQQPQPSGIFEDVTATVGIDFRHEHGGTGKRYFHEIVGSGVALLDYDNDGDLDAFFVQSGGFEPHGTGNNSGSRLFRNDLDKPGGQLRFVDVTEASGIHALGRGQGVATGDYNNDGWVDIYITMLGPNQLWLNRGNGQFENVSQASGTADESFSVSATFVDYDRDGWLDLFVGNYVLFSAENHMDCETDAGYSDYCGPDSYNPSPNRLYRNLGNGQFEEVTARTHIAHQYGPTLGVIAGDWNQDGWEDLYVANDGSENVYLVNQHGKTFENLALQAGCAANMNGTSEASMGIASADFDGDGDEDLFLTHLLNESNTLYQNRGNGMFKDQTIRFGLAGPSRGFTGFGTAPLDFDLDGWPDLIIANGAVSLLGIPRNRALAEPFPYGQTNQLLRNNQGQFEEITPQGGPGFAQSAVSRGLAIGDLDLDGDPDVMIANAAAPAQVLRNQQTSDHHWIQLDVRLAEENRTALGAKVRLSRPNGKTIFRTVRAQESYASSVDPRVLIGLGNASESAAVTITWPDTRVENFSNLALNQSHILVQGTGERHVEEAKSAESVE